MGEPSETTLKYRMRLGIIQYLATAASPKLQRKYQKGLRDARSPGCVPTEMICRWEDVFQIEDADWYSEPVFSGDEQRAALNFHRVWDKVAEGAPDPMPPDIDDLLGTAIWQELIDAAGEALAIFEKRGELLHLARIDEP
ncbi:hypothetical protein [Citromicrobium bathyomarinum]|jgi:hypothetical protein|uniref:hypothetical protein n=1 Tax=Citromicrobium bathyomarinum TaxID=72174 RepID=UPI001E451842|nr:hypothetical protein [Citromicrobium bathyomarinum]MCD1621355.1 hypothetical protein [Citromicrobium bathyomarinum]